MSSSKKSRNPLGFSPSNVPKYIQRKLKGSQKRDLADREFTAQDFAKGKDYYIISDYFSNIKIFKDPRLIKKYIVHDAFPFGNPTIIDSGPKCMILKTLNWGNEDTNVLIWLKRITLV